MTTAPTPTPEDRPLSDHEAMLVRWLLEHGKPRAAEFLPQLEKARVTRWRCPCGCASVNFTIDGQQPPPGIGLEVLSNYVWEDAEHREAGIFVLAIAGFLAGLEVYTLDPASAIDKLPSINSLRPFQPG
jgi:hypothetical protein